VQPPATHARGTLGALWSSLRPRQWIKNLLVLGAPVAAGDLKHLSVVGHCAVAFLAFCLCASGIYLLNDVVDRAADQAHPVKRHRAIASGQLTVPLAVGVGVALVLLGLAATQLDHVNGELFLVLALYVANALAYVLVIKKLVVIELGSLAAGFFLRAIAGGAAVHLAISTWFFVVVSFVALFLVVGKRLAERHRLGAGAAVHRAVLAEYTDTFLISALTLSVTVIVTGYCLWAFDTSAAGLSSVHEHYVVAIRLTVIPLVLGLLYVLRLLESGAGGAPEDLIFEDHTLQVLALVWAVLVAVGIYG
jgi:decaprenyl-phosphate phosphoribosyltransferase